MPDLMQYFGKLGPWYTGADADLGAGDMIEPGHGSKRRAPGGKLVWMHEDPAEARSYGAHLYQVEPTGILYDDSGDGGPGSWSHAGPARIVRKLSLLEHFAAYHPGPHYHGTKAELEPGDLIEPGKYPPTMPDPDIRGEHADEPREHVYFTPRKQYITEHYGPNVYQVEPTGDYTRDPEYGSRTMFRSKAPLRVVRKVTRDWGTEAGLLAHFAAAADPGFPNPYHGQIEGGDPEFSYTWFHGTKGTPDLSRGRPAETRYSDSESWPQPNKLLGTHFSPLHAVAHGFAYPTHGASWTHPPIPGQPAALVHAKLHFSDPAHFPTEEHLNLAIARWADRESPHWHDAGLNKFLLGGYQDTLGTHQDWHAGPRDDKHLIHLGQQAQHVLSWHPKLPEILHGFTQHLIGQGHHGITYGNQVEGPYGSVSAIATRPSQIEVTHVEHIAAPDREPEPHEVRHARPGDVNWSPDDDEHEHEGPYASDRNEPEEFYDKISRLHTGAGRGDFTTYPRKVRLAPGYREHKEAAYRPQRHVSLKDAARIVEQTKKNGGLSADPATGREPRHGFMVGQAGTSHVVPAVEFYSVRGPRLVRDYLEGHHVQLSHPKARLGTWHDRESGNVFLDVSRNHRDLEEATLDGKRNDQIAIWDLDSGEEISTGGSGGLEKEAAAGCGLCGLEQTGISATLQYYRTRGQPRLAAAFDAHKPAGPFAPGDHPGPFLHGGMHRVEPGQLIVHDARPASYGRLAHSYFTTSRDVAEDAADMRDGLGHGWIHTVEPTGEYETDYGEPDSFRSAHPLRVVKAEPGRLNGGTPHPPEDWFRREGALEVKDYKGTTGENRHITRNEYGNIPTSAIANMPGVRGEVPGEHRNMDDEDEWPQFKEDIARNGIRHPVFITVNHGEEPKLSEGNHRRDAAVELGLPEVPAEIRYFGHAEQQGTVLERAMRRQASSSGDRFVTCDQGHEHWGAYGAAGLLIRHRGEDGRQRYLLQKRSPYVNEPDTWSVPGGAIGKDESPEQGAWREAREEMGSIPKHVKTHHVVKSTDCGDWAYHTVVADAGEHFMPGGRGETQHETAGVGWHTADEIDELRDNGDLHPAFARSWDAVRRSRGPKTAAALYHPDVGIECEAAWDSSGSEQTGLYLRFGHWPKNERSNSPAGGYDEDGVSVYDLDKHGNPAIDHGLDRGHVHDEGCEPDCDLQRWDPDNDPRQEMLGRLHKAERNRYYGSDKPSETAHLVRGEMVAIGYDGEPLLRKVRRAGDWIDHKHLFFPGAERHRLARDEHDEGYEPPRPGRRQAMAVPTYYHGSRVFRSPGDKITTGHLTNWSDSPEERHLSTHVHMATDPDEAARFAVNAPHPRWVDMLGEIHQQEHSDPWVYEVKPTGPVEPDPDPPPGSEGIMFRSRHPLVVTRRWRAEERHPKQAMVAPGSLPPEQEAGFKAGDHKEYTRRLLDVAKNLPPGTRVWRGERRPLGDEPETAESTGMHWSVNPDSIITGWAPEGHKHVVWQGIVEHGHEQAFPRGHPIWSGRHQSYDHEAEVRFRPGTSVRLEGAYVHTPSQENYESGGGTATSPGYLVPNHPERTHPDWKWHPLNRHIRIKHGGYGASDYSDLGIPREASVKVS
jgi:ADP-ribose pyrophosphatase YjhB (NUDIX family)